MSSLQIFGLQTALSFAVYGLVAILDGAIRPLAVARRRCYARSTSLIVTPARIAEGVQHGVSPHHETALTEF